MRYGYYLAGAGLWCGDLELADQGHNIWHAYGVPDPQRFDGVSVWEAPDGPAVRLVMRNFFTGKYDVHDLDSRLVSLPNGDASRGEP